MSSRELEILSEVRALEFLTIRDLETYRYIILDHG